MIEKMNDYNIDEKQQSCDFVEIFFYPKLPQQTQPSVDGSSFRLKKSSDILSRLESEEKHYAGVRKKSKRSQVIFQNICVTAGSLSIILSMTGLGTSLSGFGVVVGVPLGAIGGLCGVLSVLAGSFSKKLGKKVSKHEQTMIIAKSKINTIKDLVSKALRDEKISDDEFKSIVSEIDKFEELKQQIRNNFRIEEKKGLRTVSESYIDLLRKEIQESLIKRLQPSAPPE